VQTIKTQFYENDDVIRIHITCSF